MNKLYTILILLITLNGFSQNFAPPGATWHYSTSGVFMEGFIRISYDGDTTIQGIQAQKLAKYISFYNWGNGQSANDALYGYEYTYADQDHVYQLIGDEFKLLYDFTVQTGDTVFVYSSEFSDPYPGCDSVGNALVTATGTMVINDLELRWYDVVSLDESSFDLNGRIIERIGNSTGYLFGQPGACFVWEVVNGPFRCYEDDDFPQYKPISGECDFVTDITQIFAPPGATWHYSYETFGLFEGYYEYNYVTDTVIQGIESQQISTNYNYADTNGNIVNNVFKGYEYIYTDFDHVYQLIGNEFKVLYDFSVQPGDTIEIYMNFDIGDPVEECDSTGRAIVNETGIDIINGKMLRWYTLESLENSPVILDGKIIERIGNSTGFLFGQPGYCVFNWEEFGGPFRCYSDDDFPEYRNPSNDEPCDFITGIDEITKADLGLQAWPNPASEKLNISAGENVVVAMVRLYEVTGVLVFEMPMTGNKIALDISNLNSGMYLLEVETEDGLREVKRLVIK